jgi:uncharacterized protein (TIGR03032 family)
VTELVLLGAPRSGAGLLASILHSGNGWGTSALSSGQLEDSLPELGAQSRGFTSHHLGIGDATPRVLDLVRQAAEQKEPADSEGVVDWNPRLSVRVGLLAAALPDAKFVLVARRPVPTISSLMDAWRTEIFESVPDLPDWWGEPWAFPLIEGWRELIGAPPARVCAAQWASITNELLDSLASLDPRRWAVCSFENLTANPAAEIATVTQALGLQWTGEIPDPLPLSSSVVTAPELGKWHRNWPELSAAMPEIQPTVDRYREVIESKRPGTPWPELEAPEKPDVDVRTIASEGTPFSSSHTSSMGQLLEQARASLVITTYKSGHVIFARSDEGKVNTEFKHVERPMGVAVAGPRLAIGSADAILTFTANAGIAAQVPSPKPVDAPYAPRSIVFTGDVAIHDMAYGADGTLYFVNTRFSCLCRQDIDYSFTPIWRPTWISGLAAEDRCHVNGLAMVDGQPRYVSALSQTDVAGGWRELKGTSGVIVDITTDQILASGLAMPHSPRWHDGQLWVLESGKGTLSTVNIATGELTQVATLPGFTRGLSFIGPYALVGLSQVRESVFSSLPITSQAAERNCGVWMVDTRNGSIAGFLKFDGVVQEIFEVAVLPATWPTIVDPGELTINAFVLAEETLKDVVGAQPPE